MNAARLDIGWKDEAATEISLSRVEEGGRTQTGLDRPALERSITRTRHEGRCPGCNSIVYSRRNQLCGVCGAPLPSELLFMPEEAQRITQLLETERQRHKSWMKRALNQA